MMEWDKQEQQQQHEEQHNENGNGNGNGGGVIYVKVMTDEQMEVLRKQIAVYGSICEQLVEMHKALTAQQDLAGVRLGNLYCDTLMTSNGHKITARQRWTPTPVQLQILERIFDKGNGTPSKQKIKEITTELSQHGPISETNVYNWFQNRRARSKRKQLVTGSNNAESEVETEVESPKEKKTKPEFHSQQIPASRTEDICFQSPEISSELHSLEPQSNKSETMFPSDGGLKPSRSLGSMSFYESVLSNPSAYSL
ncbi:hypothetical protein L1049_024110 [Liquidambar formosana]|uniref:Homeobox domain-containing protein n=1 Tax=Liquidambar formosana TaxID=63359 RepID=A0AAP0S0Y4_LIQFO